MCARVVHLGSSSAAGLGRAGTAGMHSRPHQWALQAALRSTSTTPGAHCPPCLGAAQWRWHTRERRLARPARARRPALTLPPRDAAGTASRPGLLSLLPVAHTARPRRWRPTEAVERGVQRGRGDAAGPGQEAGADAAPSAALVLEREADANLANHFSSVQARAGVAATVSQTRALPLPELLGASPRQAAPPRPHAFFLARGAQQRCLWRARPKNDKQSGSGAWQPAEGGRQAGDKRQRLT